MPAQKGQTIVFEQVLLFAIGVAIFIASFALFTAYHSHYITLMRWDQLKSLKEYMVSNIIELSEKGEFESSIIVKIPKRIGNEFYRITLSQEGLNVSFFRTSAGYDFSRLYGLNNSYTFEGNITSEKGKAIIYKKGNSIKLK